MYVPRMHPIHAAAHACTCMYMCQLSGTPTWHDSSVDVGLPPGHDGSVDGWATNCFAGASPTATTYTALISAYGKNGQLDKALEIFDDMVKRGCERNVITYSSLISVCEKAGRWELALQLFDEMHHEGCKPNVVTYNSLIAACAQGE